MTPERLAEIRAEWREPQSPPVRSTYRRDVGDLLAELDALTRERDQALADRYWNTRSNLEAENARLAAELADAYRIGVRILEETPAPNGQYEHLVICNGDRRVKPGTNGVSCCCLPTTHKLAADVAKLHQILFEAHQRLEMAEARPGSKIYTLDHPVGTYQEGCSFCSVLAETAPKEPPA